MNRKTVMILLVMSTLGVPIWAAEDDPPPPPTNRPSLEEMRNRFRNLSPQERETRLREWRIRFGTTNRAEIERRREELRRLSPAEREARLRAWRERNLSGGSPLFNRLSPAERETKRAEIQSRVENQIKELEKRQATAPLSPLEQRRLERFRQMSQRLDRASALGTPPKAGTNRPPRREANPTTPNP